MKLLCKHRSKWVIGSVKVKGRVCDSYVNQRVTPPTKIHNKGFEPAITLTLIYRCFKAPTNTKPRLLMFSGFVKGVFTSIINTALKCPARK